MPNREVNTRLASPPKNRVPLGQQALVIGWEVGVFDTVAGTVVRHFVAPKEGLSYLQRRLSLSRSMLSKVLNGVGRHRYSVSCEYRRYPSIGEVIVKVRMMPSVSLVLRHGQVIRPPDVPRAIPSRWVISVEMQTVTRAGPDVPRKYDEISEIGGGRREALHSRLPPDVVELGDQVTEALVPQGHWAWVILKHSTKRDHGVVVARISGKLGLLCAHGTRWTPRDSGDGRGFAITE